MDKKYYEVTGAELTYILYPATVKPYETPRFETAGILLTGQQKVFALDPELKEYQGEETENMGAFIKKHLLSEMDRQLSEYAGSHPDILAGIGRESADRFTRLLSTAGREIPFRPEFWLNWPKLDEGLVRIALREDAIQFNLKTLHFSKENGAPLDCPLYELLDPMGYWRQIAVKQSELGIHNAGYAELARINRFLDSCQSVHILLRDGREFVLMSGCSVTAGDLFTCASGQLELKDNSDFFLHPGPGISIEEVETLMYHRNMLDVDTAAILELFGELPGQAMGPDSQSKTMQEGVTLH